MPRPAGTPNPTELMASQEPADLVPDDPSEFDESLETALEGLGGEGRSSEEEARLLKLANLGNSQLSPRHQLEAWLAAMVQREASDLILRAGGRPSVRVNGHIQFLPGRVPNSGPLLEVLIGIIGEDRIDTLMEMGSVDVALQLDALGRFRLNAYRQMGDDRRAADPPRDRVRGDVMTEPAR